MINYELVNRFAQWLMPISRDPHSATQLLQASRNKSAMVGKRLLVAWGNAGVTREQLESAFNDDEIADLFTLPQLPNERHDHTRTSRTRKRRQQLDAKAQALGFDSLSNMLTKWKNGEIELDIKRGQAI